MSESLSNIISILILVILVGDQIFIVFIYRSRRLCWNDSKRHVNKQGRILTYFIFQLVRYMPL